MIRHAEQFKGAAIGTDDHAVVVECNDAFARRRDEFLLAVEAKHVVALAAFQQRPVLDVLGSDLDQRQRVSLRAIEAARDVERCDDASAGIEDRRCRAGQLGVLGQEMFVLVDDDRALFDDAGSHAVGSQLAFAPHRTLTQAAALRCGGKSGVANVVQDHAILVGEHDPEVVVMQTLAQAQQFDAGNRQQQAVLLASGLKLGAVDDGCLLGRLRIERVGLDAPCPGMPNAVIDVGRRNHSLDGRLDKAGVTRRFLRGQHVFLRQRRRARRPEVVIVIAFGDRARVVRALTAMTRGL
ncbi:MAG: hypothetical protein NTZ11_18620 [Gammaproteobacteria bacterium]|nr:hypothetical protein [Gammaproteobacteria bacterium]